MVLYVIDILLTVYPPHGINDLFKKKVKDIRKFLLHVITFRINPKFKVDEQTYEANGKVECYYFNY